MSTHLRPPGRSCSFLQAPLSSSIVCSTCSMMQVQRVMSHMCAACAGSQPAHIQHLASSASIHREAQHWLYHSNMCLLKGVSAEAVSMHRWQLYFTDFMNTLHVTCVSGARLLGAFSQKMLLPGVHSKPPHLVHTHCVCYCTERVAVTPGR